MDNTDLKNTTETPLGKPKTQKNKAWLIVGYALAAILLVCSIVLLARLTSEANTNRSLSKEKDDLSAKIANLNQKNVSQEEVERIIVKVCGEKDTEGYEKCKKEVSIEENDSSMSLVQTSTKGGDVELYAPLPVYAVATYPSGWKATREVSIWGQNGELADLVGGGCTGNFSIYATVQFTSPNGKIAAIASGWNGIAGGCSGLGLDYVVKYTKTYELNNYPKKTYADIVVAPECSDWLDSATCEKYKKGNTFHIFSGIIGVNSDIARAKVGDKLSESQIYTEMNGSALHDEKFYISTIDNNGYSVYHAEYSSLDSAMNMLSSDDYNKARDIILSLKSCADTCAW
ncbi:MAG: hypothetical protein LBL84_02890 [Candidatus Nomurabacteria bacterium]|jgi:hypothetical protein|nr:hypothetical protein [Candidatus Nomurabacteria bacterium]